MTSEDLESAISQHAQQLVENTLDRLPMVEWDRFVVGEDPNVGQYIEVYGWISREEDSYKDFVLVRFFPETEQNLIAYTTSSDRHTKEIHRRIFDEDPDDHNECRRVENAFDIENAIELHEQQELATDGGLDQNDGEINGRFTPICPNCSAEGERQRKVRGRTRCLDCGEVYDA